MFADRKFLAGHSMPLLQLDPGHDGAPGAPQFIK